MKDFNKTQQKWYARAKWLDEAHEGLIAILGISSIVFGLLSIFTHIMLFMIPFSLCGLVMWFLIESYSFTGCAATDSFYKLMKEV